MMGTNPMIAYVKSLRYEDQTRRFSIAVTEAGWEVREERGNELVKRQRLSDWHRVERARHSISVELETLREKGWREES